MRVLFAIAKNTYKELIRDRILYGLIVFALLIVGMSLALGQLSFTEQSRISANFGFAGIHISAVILSIFVGATLVTKEIDKKTIMTLLVRPLSRPAFVLGKSLGLMGIIFTVCIGLGFVLGLVFLGLGLEINFAFFLGLYGVFLEALLLLGITLFFGSFASPMMVVCFSLGMFLIGHWVDNLAYFASVSESGGFQFIADLVGYCIPNLERFNWRSLVLKDIFVGIDVFMATIYSIAWFGICVTFTSIILRRKDFG